MAKDPFTPPEALKNNLALPQILGTIKKGKDIEVFVAMQPPVGSQVRDANWEFKTDSKVWESGNRAPAWYGRNQPRPYTKHGLDNLWKLAPKMRPLKNVTVFPSVDPYDPKTRALYRLLMKKCSWVFKANKIMAKLVVTSKSSTTIHDRKDEDLSEKVLDAWRKKPIHVPFLNKDMTPNEIKKYIDNLARDLKADKIWLDAYYDKREQGRAVIGFFPEERDDQGNYQLPQVLKVFEPEFTRRPILNYDTGGLEAVELVGLNSNSGMLDKNRMVYMMTTNNNSFFATYYGRSDIEGVEDAGKVLLLINVKDYPAAAEYTWHKPRIFKLTIPARDYDKIDTVLQKFNYDLNNSAGKDISVTQAVENITGSLGDHGDIAGLSLIENQKIDEVAGFYNIPPFMFAKGKPGRLGGNANREEVEAFLENEVRPEQEDIELEINEQFHDRMLCILFMVEPEDMTPENVPVLVKIHFRKPKVHTLIDKEQYEIKKDMRNEGLISTEKLARDFGIEDELALMQTDAHPTDNPWWNVQIKPDMKNWMPKNLRVGSPKWPTGWPQYDEWNKKDEAGWPSAPKEEPKPDWPIFPKEKIASESDIDREAKVSKIRFINKITEKLSKK